MISEVRTFFSDIKSELLKCSWPWDPSEKGVKRYSELLHSTLMVVVAMVLLSGFVSLWDLIMMTFIGLLTK